METKDESQTKKLNPKTHYTRTSEQTKIWDDKTIKIRFQSNFKYHQSSYITSNQRDTQTKEHNCHLAMLKICLPEL